MKPISFTLAYNDCTITIDPEYFFPATQTNCRKLLKVVQNAESEEDILNQFYSAVYEMLATIDIRAENYGVRSRDFMTCKRDRDFFKALASSTKTSKAKLMKNRDMVMNQIEERGYEVYSDTLA